MDHPHGLIHRLDRDDVVEQQPHRADDPRGSARVRCIRIRRHHRAGRTRRPIWRTIVLLSDGHLFRGTGTAFSRVGHHEHGLAQTILLRLAQRMQEVALPRHHDGARERVQRVGDGLLPAFLDVDEIGEPPHRGHLIVLFESAGGVARFQRVAQRVGFGLQRDDRTVDVPLPRERVVKRLLPLGEIGPRLFQRLAAVIVAVVGLAFQRLALRARLRQLGLECFALRGEILGACVCKFGGRLYRLVERDAHVVDCLRLPPRLRFQFLRPLVQHVGVLAERGHQLPEQRPSAFAGQ